MLFPEKKWVPKEVTEDIADSLVIPVPTMIKPLYRPQPGPDDSTVLPPVKPQTTYATVYRDRFDQAPRARTVGRKPEDNNALNHGPMVFTRSSYKATYADPFFDAEVQTKVETES